MAENRKEPISPFDYVSPPFVHGHAATATPSLRVVRDFSTPPTGRQISIENKLQSPPSTVLPSINRHHERPPMREILNVSRHGKRRCSPNISKAKGGGTREGHKRKLHQTSTMNSCNQASKKPCQQLYLDFGQRNFAQQMLCKTCGMMYVHGVAEDTKQHAQICESIVKGVPFGTSQARVVGKHQGRDIVEVRLTIVLDYLHTLQHRHLRRCLLVLFI